MIAEKNESFKKDVESNELIVSEKQLQNKKEILAMYKKEYKELFSNNVSLKKQ